MNAGRLAARLGRHVGALCAAALVVSASSSTEARIAITAVPAVLDLQISPGQSVTQPVRFVNQGDHPMSVGAQIWDWRFYADKRVAMPPGTSATSMAAWFTIQPTKMEVAPGHAGTFLVTISLPRDASGGYYGLLVLDSKGLSGPGGLAVSLGAQLSVRVLINAGGTPPRVDARIIEIQPPTAHQVLKLALEIKNTGEVHVWAEPTIDLVGPFKDFVASVLPEPALRKVLLLPYESTQIRFEWGGTMPAAAYEAIATVYYGPDQVALTQSAFAVDEWRASVRPAAPASEPERNRGP